jgi:soluble lytic murein transglycosylase-like protein
MLRPGLDPELAEVHAKYIDKHVQLWCVDRDVFVSIVNAESSFNSMAENESGALGACQIMERAHKDKFKKRRIMFRKEIFYLDNNYSLGCEIYYEAVQNSDTLEGALTRYVGGSNPEYVEQVKKDAKKCKAMIKNELIIDEELGGFIY